MLTKPPSLKLLGVRIDRVDWPSLVAFCREVLTGDQPRQIVTVNGEFILLAGQHQRFQEVINTADLVIPDSTNVVWLSRLKTAQPLPAVTPGSDLTERLCQLAIELDKTLFLLGGRSTVAKQAASRLKSRYPGLKIVGTSNRDPDDPQAISAVARAKPDILLVAYGAPRQELWIAQHKHQTGAKIMVGVGGTFDMLAGKLPRAPRPLRQLHLEWLWRLVLQPSRIGRIWRAVVVFPWKVLTS